MVGPHVDNSMDVECHTAAFVPVGMGLLNQGEEGVNQYIDVFL